MPVIAQFYGIIIRMYFLQSEHNPPHIHAIYGDDAATFDIRTGTVLDGSLPHRATAMVQEWMMQNRLDLMEIWKTQEFKRLPGLD